MLKEAESFYNAVIKKRQDRYSSNDSSKSKWSMIVDWSGVHVQLVDIQ